MFPNAARKVSRRTSCKRSVITSSDPPALGGPLRGHDRPFAVKGRVAVAGRKQSGRDFSVHVLTGGWSAGFGRQRDKAGVALALDPQEDILVAGLLCPG